MVRRLLGDSSEIIEGANEFITTPDIKNAYINGKLDLDQINRISALVTKRERLFILLKSTLLLDERTHESELIHSSMTYGLVAGFTIGFIAGGKDRHKDFVRNYNQAVFENVYISKRKYLDTYISQGAIKSANYALKLSILSGCCTGALIVPMIIRDDEYRVMDSTLAMGVVCGLARLNFGAKAMAVSSVIGMGLGALSGAIIKSYLSFTGKTPQEIRFWNHSRYVKKKLQKIKKMEEKE